MQGSKCMKLLQEAKVSYYNQVDTKNFSDNKTFWKTVKPVFSEKVKAPTAISLLGNNEIVADVSKIAGIFNEYFINFAKRDCSC